LTFEWRRFATKKKRFSIEQIVAILKQAELGMSIADLIRQTGISEQTFYWQLGKNQAYRLYSQEQLQLRSKLPKRRMMVVTRQLKIKPTGINQAWSTDFVADQLANGCIERRCSMCRVSHLGFLLR
jgi:hypothetical protein